MARTVNCVKLKREAEGLDFPPYPGELGKQLWASGSKEAWQQWLEDQKEAGHDNRLNLSDPRARKYLEEQMRRHFFEGGAAAAAGFVPQAAWKASAAPGCARRPRPP